MDEYEKRKGLSFKQAEGIDPLPAQMRRNEISQELRSRLWAIVYDMMRAHTNDNSFPYPDWSIVFRDVHVRYFHGMADEFIPYLPKITPAYKRLFQHGAPADVLDFAQWLLRHGAIGGVIADQIATVLEETRSAYRVVGGDTLVPVSSSEEARTIAEGIGDLEDSGMMGAAAHLRTAAENLSQGLFPDSIRESIHAVESVARQIEPSGVLSKALEALEAKGHIHPALKKGFLAIYGYTSDEKGIRHALLEKPEADAGETEALFMIGAASAFVSYLLNKRGEG